MHKNLLEMSSFSKSGLLLQREGFGAMGASQDGSWWVQSKVPSFKSTCHPHLSGTHDSEQWEPHLSLMSTGKGKGLEP